MAILSRDQLRAVRQRNDMEMSKGAKSSFGYPKDLVHDLLQTIDFLHKEKKKWQRVSEHRGSKLGKILDLCAEAARVPEDAPEEVLQNGRE